MPEGRLHSDAMTAELPPSLTQFIRSCIPTYDAAEVLLFFASHLDRAYAAEEVVVAMRPTELTVAAVKEYTAVFATRGLIVEKAHGTFLYAPNSAELERAVGELADAYDERPVTLIKMIDTLHVPGLSGGDAPVPPGPR